MQGLRWQADEVRIWQIVADGRMHDGDAKLTGGAIPISGRCKDRPVDRRCQEDRPSMDS